MKYKFNKCHQNSVSDYHIHLIPSEFVIIDNFSSLHKTFINEI